MYQVYKPRRGLKRGDDSKVSAIAFYFIIFFASGSSWVNDVAPFLVKSWASTLKAFEDFF